MKTPRELAVHLAGLARQHRIELNVVKDMPPERAHASIAGFRLFGATFNLRAITIAPVGDETTYAVALHEMGHCVAPGAAHGQPIEECTSIKEVQRKILAEQLAWEWAQANAIEWSVAMEQNKQMSLTAYEDFALGYVRAIIMKRRDNAKAPKT